jgi:hypothetical protein
VLPYLRSARRVRNGSGLPEEKDVSGDNQKRNYGQNRTPNLANVDRRLVKGTCQPGDDINQTNGRQQEVDPRENVGNWWRQPQKVKKLRGNASQRYEQAVPESGIGAPMARRRDECVRHKAVVYSKPVLSAS